MMRMATMRRIAVIRRIRSLLVLACFTALCVFTLGRLTQAATIPTRIYIDPIASPMMSGKPFTVTGLLLRLVETGTVGVPNRDVKLYLETITSTTGISPTFLLANVYSDINGRLSWIVHKRLSPGQYRLYYRFTGTKQMFETQASTDLTIIPGPPRARADGVEKPEFITALDVNTSADTIDVGEIATVTVRLTDESARPIAGQLLHLKLPNTTLVQKSDREGAAAFVIKRPLTPGENIGRVYYHGARLPDVVYTASEEPVQFHVNEPENTELVFDPLLKKQYVGDKHEFTVQLLSGGQPVPDAFVRFYVNGVQRVGARTDQTGHATMRLARDAKIGPYLVSATYGGSQMLIKTANNLQFTMLPEPFSVRTVPAMANIPIMVGSTLLTTDEEGVARMLVSQSGALTVTVLPFAAPDSNTRAVFNRWSDDVFTTTRRLNVTNGKAYQIGLELSHRVTQEFVEDNSKRPVVSARVSHMLLLSSAGESITVLPGEELWLKANRIIRRGDALASSQMSYYINSATVDGVNVVNEGQQKFETAPAAVWTVHLNMFDMAVDAHDALFGFRVGNGVKLVLPAGTSREIKFDKNGPTKIPSLSRGDYVVTVEGAAGVRAPMPISLNRPQDVMVAVISYLDIAVVLGAGLFIAVAALLVGRTKLTGALRRRMRKAPN